jgi:hypothetical protein
MSSGVNSGGQKRGRLEIAKDGGELGNYESFTGGNIGEKGTFAMSPSGSDVLHGGHSCLPFETDGEKHEAVAVFMHEGLSRGARCLFVGTPEDYDQLRTDLELLGICSRKAIARSALTFATPEEIYFESGAFDGNRTLARYDHQIDRALAEGFVGLRTTAELHMLPDDVEWRRIVQYEAQVNEHFARRPISGLCRYPTSLVPPDRVRDVLRTHPVAVLRGDGCDNPFYERPELVLSDDSRTRLDWQFRQLRVQHRARLHLEGTRESAVAAAAELAAELHQLRSHLAKSKPD